LNGEFARAAAYGNTCSYSQLEFVQCRGHNGLVRLRDRPSRY